MGIDKEGAERMRAMGKETIYANYLEYHRDRFYGGKKPRKTPGGFCSRYMCLFVILVFFGFLVSSKLSEETWALMDIRGGQEFKVGPADPGLLRDASAGSRGHRSPGKEAI